MSENQYDVVIIGGGPGGYVGAIRAAQLGLKVAVIDRRARLGGTCLNVGCIPSKALLNSTEKYEEAGHSFASHGIEFSELNFNLATMMLNKDNVIDTLSKGIDGLMKKNKVIKITGFARFISSNEVEVTDKSGEVQQVFAKNFVIATGSEIMSLPFLNIDEERIVSSTGALSLNEVPKKMIVIGGGYIGLEMGSVWRRLGSEVEVVEFLDIITPTMDKDVSVALKKVLEEQGMKFKMSTKVVGAERKDDKVILDVESVDGSVKEKIEADVVLVAIGRRPFTDNLGLENTKVQINDRGRIVVDDHYKTAEPNIYAIGDVIPGAMLAHKSEKEGIAVAEIIAGQAGHVNYDAIPGVIYTYPEAASVGKTEQELKAAGIEYKIGKFPFMANSRARAIGDISGFVKILADSKSDKIYGVHIIGPEAGTMIAEAVLAMEYSASSEDIARTCHAHPTLNEAVKEACMAVLGRAIHI